LASKQKQQKNFAYTVIAAILLFGGFGFYRYRQSKKLQNQRAILSERLRISSELHDEVGATLSGIAMYSHLTKEQMKAGQTVEIEKSLSIMQQSSAQMVNKLSDIVWLINPEQDSLKKLVTRLEEYARDMAAIKNMQVKISVPEKIADINLPVESRRNIYLFCKEAINNAVKYSNATLLELTVKEVNGKLEFSVSDNGKGFDAVMVRRGNGLENMQKRADEIGAKLILQSKENEGASVCLQCKIT
jgi:signal transduction histidine kinase